MPRLLFVLSISLLLFATTTRAQPTAPTNEAPRSAGFKVAEVANLAGAPSNMTTYAASSGSGDAQARFLIEIDGEGVEGKVHGRADPGSGFFFFKGRFRHVAGSRPAPFLAKVAKALGAKAPRMSQAQAEVVPFELALIGSHMSRDSMGGFDGKPPGDWVAIKLFLANGQAEVYFNYNVVSGDAEFSPKDEDYGNLVVEELSKVLW